VSLGAHELYALLPAIVRARDAERGGPLQALLTVLAEQAAVVEENLAQLYDDQFIETCADWVVPYIGDLIGYRTLHGVVPEVASPRAEVANTIVFRRRKGTAAMLEQLARDVTGWPARVVEFFQLIAATQYMNHLRPQAAFTAAVRPWEPLERRGTAFDSLPHTVDVRRITTGAGRYNLRNIGIFLWRLQAYRLEDSVAVPAAPGDALRFHFSPLAHDAPLFSRAVREPQITHLAEPINVPMPLSRRVLDAGRDVYYGSSIVVTDNGAVVPAAAVRVCDLRDVAGGWAGQPAAGIAIDPVLGRIVFAQPPAAGGPRRVGVTFHYGFSADMGGGPYERGATLGGFTPPQALVQVPDSQPTIGAALAALPSAGGIVEITDNGRYEEAIQVTVAADASIEIRAVNGRRPTLVLTAPLRISGGAGATAALDGLLITSAAVPAAPATGLVHVPAAANALRRLTLRHCTLVPGWALEPGGAPRRPAEPGLVVAAAGVEARLDRCIVGGLRVAVGSTARVAGSILDATDPRRVAYAAPDGLSAGGAVALEDCTVVGAVSAATLDLVSNTIVFATPGGPLVPPVSAVRRQEGCIRFSFVPVDTVGPRRYRCQPDLEVARRIEETEARLGGPLDEAGRSAVRDAVALSLVPSFTSLRYGDPGYGQLRRAAPSSIRTGADDEAEMGAFHHLYQPQRETNLHVRLDEYLRFGLEAGTFYET
jgi:hypothetical protein